MEKNNSLKQRNLHNKLEDIIPEPGKPRVNQALDREHPNQPPRIKDLTVLQQHVEFFDRSKTGIINPWDTYFGFRDLGFNIPFSLLAIPIIHLNFSYATQDSWIPDPLFRIIIKNIHRAKHGSDQEVFDNEGRFVPQKFDETFNKFDEGNKGALTFKELLKMTEASKNIMDPIGWFAGKFEFGTLWLLAQRDGMVSKEVIRGQYDGSLFYKIAAERKLSQKSQKDSGSNKKESFISKMEQKISNQIQNLQDKDKKTDQNLLNGHHPNQTSSFISFDNNSKKKKHSSHKIQHGTDVPIETKTNLKATTAF